MKLSDVNKIQARIDESVRELNSVFFEASHAGLRIDTEILENTELSGITTPLLVVVTYVQPHQLEPESE